MRLTALLIALSFPATSLAQDRQYRKLELTDGRVLLAEVLATESTGLMMRVPQGETLISFELLKDMVPITGNEYRDQKPVQVWLHAPTSEKELRAIYATIPQLGVVTAENPRDVPPGIVLQLERCGANFDCMGDVIVDRPWMWLVTATEPTDSTDAALIFRGRVSGGALPNRTNAKTRTVEQLWAGAHEAVALVPPSTIPKTLDFGADVEVPNERTPGDWTQEKVLRASFVPIPGYPSLAQGDGGGFALGLGTVVGGTAALAGVLVASKIKPGEAVPVGIIGFYALTVTANQAFGTRTLKRNGGIVMDVSPTAGGFVVRVGGKL